MKKICVVIVLAISSASIAQAGVPCERQISSAAVDALTNSSIVQDKNSVQISTRDGIYQDRKADSWLVDMMFDDPCYAKVRVTLKSNSCSVVKVKIVSHECTDN